MNYLFLIETKTFQGFSPFQSLQFFILFNSFNHFSHFSLLGNFSLFGFSYHLNLLILFSPFDVLAYLLTLALKKGIFSLLVLMWQGTKTSQLFKEALMPEHAASHPIKNDRKQDVLPTKDMENIALVKTRMRRW